MSLRDWFRRRPRSSQSEPQERKLTDSEGLQVVKFSPDISSVLRLYGVSGSYARLFATQYNIRTAIDAIAREGASLVMHVYEADPRGPLLPDAQIELTEHPVRLLLDEPSPGMSQYRWWYSLFADLATYDIAYWIKVRQRGVVKALLRVPPQNLNPDRDPVTGRVRAFNGPGGVRVPREDMVVFWGYDPAMDEGSIPPMETLRRLISEEVAAGLDREGRWRNSSRKDGIIEREVGSPEMDDVAKEGFLLDLEDSTAGPGGSGRPVVLQKGMHWNDVQWSPREMEYIAARKLSRVEVSSFFHMPAAMLSAAETGEEPDDKTLNYFYTSTLPPWLTRVEREVEAQLVPEFELTPARRRVVHVAFNLDEKLRGSFEQRIAILATAAGGPIITVNEARAREKLPPIDGGDAIFVPLNSIRAGGPQASPQNPTETPATGLEPAGTTPGGGTVGQASLEDVRAGRAVVLGGKEAQLALSPHVDSLEDLLLATDARFAARRAQEEHELYLSEQRGKYSARARQEFLKTFERQRRVVEGGRSLKQDRWNRELSDDLYGLLLPAISTIGDDAAARLGGEFDQARAAAAVRQKADSVATDVNTETNETEDFTETRAEKLAESLSSWLTDFAVEQARRRSDEGVN